VSLSPAGMGEKASQAHELLQPFHQPAPKQRLKERKKNRSVVSYPSQKKRSKKKIRRILDSPSGTNSTYIPALRHDTPILYVFRKYIFRKSIMLLYCTHTSLFIALVFIVRAGVYTVQYYSIRMEKKACFL
jgi:hypothetical protein